MNEHNTEAVTVKDVNHRNGAAVILISVLLSLVIGLSGGFVAARYLISQIPKSEPSTNVNQNPTNVTISVDESSNSNIEAVAKKALPSVVFVRTSTAVDDFFGGSSEPAGEGSGVVYSEDGYVVTNYSVIQKAVENANVKVEVFFQNNLKKPVKAEIVGYNISYDLAVLKVNATGLTPIELGSVKGLAAGQYVAAISSPGGIDYMGTVTYGIISGVNRKVENSASNEKALSLIQTDAILNTGFTGGALVNIKGQLIGIASSKIVSVNVSGMGFAIPVDKVKEVCDKVIDKGDTPDPYIGVSFSDIWSAERLKEYGYPVGAVVKSVVENGPAHIAGIGNGDIITEFGGEKVNGFEELNGFIAKCQPGDTVSVKYYRSGRYLTTAITVGSNNSQ
ncbi:MAG: trypsin-like peptidase domain-containing protein [Clostridia bacterium]|nr:trypsin-like peptidase domain-containing protein [Clostridia bacterium]